MQSSFMFLKAAVVAALRSIPELAYQDKNRNQSRPHKQIVPPQDYTPPALAEFSVDPSF